MPKYEVGVELKCLIYKKIEANSYDEAVEQAIAETTLEEVDGFTCDCVGCFEI